MRYDEILDRIESRTGLAPRPSGSGHVARCPAHPDDTPSLTLSKGDDGRTLAHCQRGCAFDAVASSLGLEPSDFFDRDEAPAAKVPTWDPFADGRATATYSYTDAGGRELFQVRRFEPKAGHPAHGLDKTFRARHRGEAGRWRWKLPDGERPLYRLPGVLEAARAGRVVFVVEGEKDADRLSGLGLVATCNPGGGSTGGANAKWRPEHTAALAGASVVVVPDHDAAGRAHASAVAAALTEAGATVRVLDLATLPDGRPMPPKGDVSDWLDAGGELAGLQALARAAPIYSPAQPVAAPPARPQLGVCLADVEAEAVRWMWPGWLAAGKVHVFDGNPGMGKSTIVAALSASVTAGVPWPDGRPVPTASRGGVVILTAEDDPATTIRPRMEAAGADVNLARVVSVVPTENGAGRLPTFPADVELIVGACRDAGARLLVVDPVTAYLGDVNSHRDSDVRGALAPLAAAAEEAGVAVVLIRHLNKGVGGSALYRGGGSIAFSGLARVVWIVGTDPDDEDRRALAVSKNNLAAFPETIGYELVNTPPLNVGRVEWGGPLSLSADDLVRPPVPSRPSPAQEAASAFVLDALADGPRLARELYEAAEADGISKRSLVRAKSKLNIEAERRGGAGGDGAWYWLPPETGFQPKDASSSIRGTLSDSAPNGQTKIGLNGTKKPKDAKLVASLADVAPLAPGGTLSETSQNEPWEDEAPF